MRVLLTGFLAFLTLLALNPLGLAQQQFQASPPVRVSQVLHGGVFAEEYLGPVPAPILQTVPHATGQVRSESAGSGLASADVSIPQIGFDGRTAKDGSFALPALPVEPTIVRFSKPGFVPKSITLDADWQASGRKLLVSLREIRNTLVLDQDIRHLGDNSYSPVSAGADRFQRPAGSPKLVRQFVTPEGGGPVYLEIGSVIGLDTQAAHALRQSSFHRTSTPMTIKVNGQLLSYLTANGDGQRIPVPRSLLRTGALNTLEIQTGYQVPDGSYIDYDDMELMLITLEY